MSRVEINADPRSELRALIADLRQSAAIMQPRAAAQWRRWADLLADGKMTIAEVREALDRWNPVAVPGSTE